MPGVPRFPKKGFVLVFALWVLAFLTVLAVSVASGIRQKIIMVRKLDERNRAQHLLESGASLAKVYIRQEMAKSEFAYTPLLKNYLHDNPLVFDQILLGDDRMQIGYTLYDNGSAVERFGVVDEERKLNLNFINDSTLQRLLERVLVGINAGDVKRLTRSILDWRQEGTSEATGFFSDDYYDNLQYPYRKKNANYETMDELLLVKGVSKDVYERIGPYVTVYGDGKININTVSGIVLSALGLEDVLVEKILAVRRGKDGVEATLDDHVFINTFDVAAEVNAVLRLDLHEIRAIDQLNLQGILTGNSYYFSMNILAQTPLLKNLRAVFSLKSNRFLYWREK